MPYLRNFRTNIVANVLGNTIDEYIEISERLDSEDIDAIELNVSCPNVKQGGISFGVDFLQLRKLLMAVRSVVKKKTLIVKLSPNVTDIRIFARTAEDEGADAVSMINTVMAMSINVKTRKSRIAGMIGGLSGPAIRPVAVRMVWEVHNAVKIPIIGMGGIMTYEDALEFILAGATSVAVGTANFIDPISSLNIINGMREYMSINNVADIHDLIGGVNE